MICNGCNNEIPVNSVSCSVCGKDQGKLASDNPTAPGSKQRKKSFLVFVVCAVVFILVVGIMAAIQIPSYVEYKKRAYVVAININTDIKNAYMASQNYLTEYPSATVTSLSQLKEGGYVPSEGVKFVHADITTESGTIELKADFPIRTNVAIVNYEGKIIQKAAYK